MSSAVALITTAGVLVIALRGDSTVPITGYSVAEPRTLVLHVETGPSDEVLGGDVIAESDSAVQVQVRADLASSQPQVAVEQRVRVSLVEPLGDRAVLDQNGDPVAARQ